MSYLSRDIKSPSSSERVELEITGAAKRFNYNFIAYDDIIEENKPDQHDRQDYRRKINRIIKIKKGPIPLMTIEFDKGSPWKIGVSYRSLKGIIGKKTVNKFLDETSLF